MAKFIGGRFRYMLALPFTPSFCSAFAILLETTDMASFLGSLLVGLLKALFGWAAKRKNESDRVKQAEHQATVEAGESTARDRTAQRVAADREKGDADLDRASADAGGVGGLRKQSADIAAAVDDANREVR